MAANDSALYDEDGDSSDWIEIHNPDDVPHNLAGYFLTNDAGDLAKWRLPELTLNPGEFTVVFASNKDRDIGELHANFRLASDGGYLALVEPDAQTLASEYASYPAQPDDFSYGLAQTGSSSVLALVRENDNCTLLVPSADIGTGWRDLGFDDASWRPATTGVGYERSIGYENLISESGDVEAETHDINSTVYVRIPFSVGELDQVTSLTLRMKYDDGFVAFLNGVEVASGNRPASLEWNSDASQDHSDNLAVNFVDTDLSAQLGLLNVGDNLLAIHSMNGDPGSSDLLALPRLEVAVTSNPGLGEPGYFQVPSPAQSNGTDQGLPAGDVEFSTPGRGFTGTLSLTLSTESPAGQIRYTTNGDVPTQASSLYGAAIPISSSTLVRARVFETDLAPGAIAEEGYIRLSADALAFSSDLPVVIMERFSGGPS
ncbi:MAG: chitobiase/beta-hexosaminidase C-terminal domain-containing protein, partial [Verrucomicrobiales bacterium]